MAQVSLTHEAAIERYLATLSAEDKLRCVAATVRDVLLDVEELERRQALSSKTRRISKRLDPFIKFLQRYAMAVDTIVQFDPAPSALAWGCFRFIIEVRLVLLILYLSNIWAYHLVSNIQSSGC